ncbi:lysosome-associated membrane glycoprotein [Holotrichia oblita]|uniref:Lysosome-associated membrane glycoprotein n=1 Tax=Holotrichia oblita TaxID=644536 RepID=A0ACB9TFJ0_HOLOL|nr:lysosome-associated membrane glycoprotein [Holotrichia oblita]
MYELDKVILNVTLDSEDFPTVKAPEVTNTTVAPITSSSLKPTTTVSTTPKPITTSSTTTSTTVTPTTTSTSTTAPTTSTTSPSPPTTTTSPSTTSAAPVTTTVAPTPGPQQGTWEVTNTTNSSCIVLKMAAEIEVNFTTTDNKVANSTIFVPLNATVSGGDCGNNQSITLSFSFINGTNNTIKFLFSENDKKFELDAVNVTLVLDSTNFPDAKNKTFNAIHKKVDFVTPVGMSYKCDKQQALDLYLPNTTTSVGAVKISKFQFQAYGNIINRHFADAKDCEGYETPDIVPIAVGCALMVLIVIVLVGYLIGRRRNQARGYLSM